MAMKARDDKRTWLTGIYLGMMANSVIIFFWVPMFFYLAPGQGYRHMLGVPCSLPVAFATLIYGIFLAGLSLFNRRYVMIKMAAIILNFLPTILLVGIVILLGLRDNYPKP
jgi:predicted membrane-bound mannosyltransferase